MAKKTEESRYKAGASWGIGSDDGTVEDIAAEQAKRGKQAADALKEYREKLWVKKT